ncbi:hypothetical protein [Rhodopila globiformis]|uniref:Uncharacterized protein n=1 Tax=Rhodopila globiformis TaxID=1071 RepID=A0A2S6N7B9_RHOGL|nr:hypothetical protein [Rhodopila globiformis]PPQ30506.1 hypothetical protein CCS01_19095 [Rhodopila globiformis]
MPEVLFLSLDSLAAGTLIGLSGAPVPRARMALAFGLCDALGALVGHAAGPAVPLLAGAACVLLALRRAGPWHWAWPWAIPLLLGLDSVLFPVAPAAVPALAAASAGLAWLGLTAASSRRLGSGWRLGMAAIACALLLI